MGGLFSVMAGWFSGDENKVGILPEDLGDDADIPDPVSSMTKREVAYVTSSWALVKQDLRTHGIKFFLLLFETHPELQDRFDPFRGIPLDELINNKRLAGHAATVMGALDTYVTNLDDISVVIEMLKTTGQNHKRRNVLANDFHLLSPVLVQYLSEALGPALSAGGKAAWVHLLNVIMSVITGAYAE